MKLVGHLGLVSIALAAIAALGAPVAFAQQYPAKPISFIVPLEAGGPIDLLARTIGRIFAERNNMNMVVENRPGANFTIAANACAKARADGYTICFLLRDNISILPFQQEVPYDPIKDFVPVANVAYLQNVMVVHPSVPANNFRDFIEYSKRNPNKVNYTAFGSSQSIVEWLKQQTGADMTFIPFKGGPSAMQAFMGGQIHAMYLSVSNPGLIPQILAGKIAAIAVPGDKRNPLMPEVPSFAEVGLPVFPIRSWLGVFAPAGTPRDAVAKLSSEFVSIVRIPQFREKDMIAVGFDPIGASAEEFARMIPDDRKAGEQLARMVGPRL